MATRSWNRVELIGNLTRDPELRYTPTGTAVVSFSIATNRTYISDGERKEEADFHRIVAWNKLAELCSQLLKKGSRVFVSGRLQNRSWQGQDGTQRQVTEIVIEDMLLLTPKNGAPSEYVPPEAAKPPAKTPEETPKEEVKEEPKEKEPTPVEQKTKTEDPGNLDDLPF